MTGSLFIVCAASGTGKTSLVKELLKADPGIKLSVSYTTRQPRPGDVDGREYHFISTQEFEDMMARGEFLESAQVHGNYYGTSQSWIAAQRDSGSDILLEIDWQGAAQVRKLIPDCVCIFILPPSLEALTARLNNRAQDHPEVIAKRLAAARAEISHFTEFDYVIINDKFDAAVRDLTTIVRARRLLLPVQLARYHELINRLM
ncbi:MAG TPA: guanylate kinase [Burkholderiales bacterium]|jgi:guanylate kinase|nr:guanylate kinase [Burkholderiales bacterium]